MSQELREKLKAARARLGLTQKEAASSWGVPLRTLICWENDQRTPGGFSLKQLNQLLEGILTVSPSPDTEKPPGKKPLRKQREIPG